MIAYKFLEGGRVAPFTRFRWPVGEWVEAAGVGRCRRGVHAITPLQLPYWLGSELWEIELGGDVVADERKLVASRGRLLRRVEGWGPALLDEFAADLVRGTRSRVGSIPVLSGFVADVERFRAERRVGLAAFAAARAAERLAGPRAYDEERLRQARWLAGRLGLPAG